MPCICDTCVAYSTHWTRWIKSHLTGGEDDGSPCARKGRGMTVGCSLRVILGGTVPTHAHTLPFHQPLASLQEKHKAQENDYSHVVTGTAVRGSQEFTAASNTCWLSYPNATVLPGKEKEDGEKVFMWLFYTHETKKKGPVKQSCRNFLLIVKGFLFSILTWLNKEYFI